MTISPSSREIALAFPKVYRTRPRLTSSTFASRTCLRNFSNMVCLSYFGGDTAQQRKNLSQSCRFGIPGAHREVSLTKAAVNEIRSPRLCGFRFEDTVGRTQRILSFFDTFVCTRREECEDSRSQTRRV